MTKDIDWPMTVGTLLLAAFLGWVVLAMYRPLPPARALGPWANAANVQDMAAAPARPLPGQRPH